jgi:virginiamycin B lyase
MWFSAPGGAVGRITTTGAATLFPTPGAHPQSITTGPDGNLWFTSLDPNSGSTSPPAAIGRLATNGTWTSFPTTLHPDPSAIGAITTGPDGNLWFSGNGIERITPAGVISPISGGSGDLALGADGNVWFNTGTAVGSVTVGGTATTYAIPGASVNDLARGIAPGPDHNMWFTDSDHVDRVVTGA